MNRQKNRQGRQTTVPHARPTQATILVILALPEELEYFNGIICNREGWSTPTHRSRFKCEYEASDGPVQVVVQTLPSMGNIEASLLAGAGIAQATPDLVMMVGLA